jgi:formate-dependent phosphoribosylglycinamide formyltransferase (GAR transformylase)
MAKVLLVDTNFSSQPIYDELVQMGHDVHVVGGNPSDCLAKSVENYWQVDYALVTQLAELVERERFDFLVPGCTDRSYSSCSAVSRGRFPGIETIQVDQILNHKDRFRELGLQLKLPVPNVQWQDGDRASGSTEPDLDNLVWPLVIKPVDAFSGKGITVLSYPQRLELSDAITLARKYSARGMCLIEDYKNGQLHSHSAFLSAGRVVQDVVVVEHGTINPFVVDTSRIVINIPDAVIQNLRSVLENLAGALGLCDGLFHTQFILDGTQPWLIESTRRCPGDLYSQLVELSGRSGYVKNYIRPFLGLSFVSEHPKNYHPVMRHTVTVSKAQNFSHLQFHRSVLLEKWVPLCLTGDPLQASPESRIGILFAKEKDIDSLDQLFAATLSRELYEVKN